MNQSARAAALAGTVMMATVSAHAGVSVTGYNCFPLPAGACVIVNNGNEHYTITLKSLYAMWADSIYEIRPTSPGVVIDDLFVTINGPPAGSPVIIRIYPKCGDPAMLIQSVNNILQQGTAETLLNYVTVAEDIGRIEIEAIGDMYCGRDLVGPIISTTTDNTVRGINAIQAQRHVLGDLIAMQGRVGYITAFTGNIGTAAQPILIRAKHDVLKLDSRLGNVYADIDTRVSGGDGSLTFLNAGEFHGRLQTLGLKTGLAWNGQIVIRGSLDADISFDNGFSRPAFITLPVGGLHSRIVFNAANHPNVSWSGPVNFTSGTTTQFTISGPGYAQMPSLLGGGSLGLAPFGLQGNACVPPANATLSPPTCGAPPSVRLRFYGPISVNGAAPLSITRRPGGSGPYSIVPPSNFTYAIPADDRNALVITPKPAVTIGFTPGYEYRITPQAQLACADVVALPPVQDFEYRVTVASGPTACPADLECNGLVNGVDLAILLGSWGPCSGCAADLNGNGSVNGVDLAMLLGSWGACGSPRPH